MTQPNQRYGLKSVVINDTTDELAFDRAHQRLRSALDEGWEPFSVIALDGLGREVWLRRHRDNAP